MDVTTLPMEERLQLTEFFVEAPAVKTCFVTIRRCDQLSAKTSGLYSVLAAAGIRRTTILKSGTVWPPGGEERHRRLGHDGRQAPPIGRRCARSDLPGLGKRGQEARIHRSGLPAVRAIRQPEKG